MICDLIPSDPITDDIINDIIINSNIRVMLVIIGVAVFIGLLLFLLLRNKKGE